MWSGRGLSFLVFAVFLVSLFGDVSSQNSTTVVDLNGTVVTTAAVGGGVNETTAMAVGGDGGMNETTAIVGGGVPSTTAAAVVPSTTAAVIVDDPSDDDGDGDGDEDDEDGDSSKILGMSKPVFGVVIGIISLAVVVAIVSVCLRYSEA